LLHGVYGGSRHTESPPNSMCRWAAPKRRAVLKKGCRGRQPLIVLVQLASNNVRNARDALSFRAT